MNCKPGDLAVIVSGDFPEDIGLIVSVINQRTSTLNEAAWLVETLGQEMTLYEVRGGKRTGEMTKSDVGVVPDKDLRPIRDSDGTDETLTWAGKPRCEPA